MLQPAYDSADDADPLIIPMPLQPTTATTTTTITSAPTNNTGAQEEGWETILVEQGFTHSLTNLVHQAKQAFALRIWVVDNSGSMQHTDGHRLVTDNPNIPTNTNMSSSRNKKQKWSSTNQQHQPSVSTNSSSRTFQLVPCTRWAELADTVEYHLELADLIQAPTRIRFLNPPGGRTPSQFQIVAGEERKITRDIKSHDNYSSNATDPMSVVPRQSPFYPVLSLQDAIRVVRSVQPMGCTPLSQHIRDIHKEITALRPYLQGTGQRVAVIIATDGLPTDDQGMGGHGPQREFVSTLRMLEGLPVWVVIRLCTDEESVTEFYNNLDAELELSMEVLDDFVGEAGEVQQMNRWLNYGLPLHRIREMGCQHRLLDLLDERPFTLFELRDFLYLLYGPEIPDPCQDWLLFVQWLQERQNQYQFRTVTNDTTSPQQQLPPAPQWNPQRKKLLPWIDITALHRMYREQPWWKISWTPSKLPIPIGYILLGILVSILVRWMMIYIWDGNW